jgi:hypothetical protein
MSSKEWAVFNALSTKYAFKSDFGLGDGVSKNATISQDHTGSRETKEIAALQILVKKYGSLATQVTSTAQGAANDKSKTSEQTRPQKDISQPGQDIGENVLFDGNMDVLQDFDFDSFLHQDGEDVSFGLEGWEPDPPAISEIIDKEKNVSVHTTEVYDACVAIPLTMTYLSPVISQRG